ncbi:Acyl-CoA-binding protein 3 [Parelaphostrongylus tenuis]|uniref:Acyl-CoA-binding protein 3 n=1 Tax=Parelaphostrongylus tenuis TaxID=148309 RepID=A0AAD5QW89_PARTN|nr:Acyl-CoA-binding protein 3 [Parelaphostrongylus tenuis]
MALDNQFDAAVTIIQKLPKEGPVSTSNEQKLQFYSLYKQATIGDVNTERPGIFSIIERRKWDAWKAVEGLNRDEAKRRYIKVLLEMFDKIAEVRPFLLMTALQVSIALPITTFHTLFSLLKIIRKLGC